MCDAAHHSIEHGADALAGDDPLCLGPPFRIRIAAILCGTLGTGRVPGALNGSIGIGDGGVPHAVARRRGRRRIADGTARLAPFFPPAGSSHYRPLVVFLFGAC
jgi:hypothetical protein